MKSKKQRKSISRSTHSQQYWCPLDYTFCICFHIQRQYPMDISGEEMSLQKISRISQTITNIADVVSIYWDRYSLSKAIASPLIHKSDTKRECSAHQMWKRWIHPSLSGPNHIRIVCLPDSSHVNFWTQHEREKTF